MRFAKYKKIQKELNNYAYFFSSLCGCKIHVIFNDNWHEMAEKIYKLAGDSIYFDKCTHAQASHLKMNGPNEDVFIMFFETNISDEIICHECMHILTYIMGEYNLSFDIKQTELLAYLMQELFAKTVQIKSRINFLEGKANE